MWLKVITLSGNPTGSQRPGVWQKTWICASGKGDKGIQSSKCTLIPINRITHKEISCLKILIKTLLRVFPCLSQTIVPVSLIDIPGRHAFQWRVLVVYVWVESVSSLSWIHAWWIKKGSCKICLELPQRLFFLLYFAN